jgi:hypothetical protein
MRVAVLMLAFAVAGCSRPAREALPDVALAPAAQESPLAPPARDIEPELPSVRQGAEYYAYLERTRVAQEVVERGLQSGRFKLGSKLDDVLAACKPDAMFHHGDYTTAVYAGGAYFTPEPSYTLVIARDGKLVRAYARSCVLRPAYFNGLTEAEAKVCSQGFWNAHRSCVERVTWKHSHRSARMAVAGPIAAVVSATGW